MINMKGKIVNKDIKTIERMTQSIVNKMLHEPTQALREASGGRRGVALVETARLFYGLDKDDSGEGGFRLIRSLLGRRASAVSKPDTAEIGE